VSRHDRNRAAILALCLALALAGCGNDEPSEGNPGTLRVAKAVLKSFLSNSVEATETEATPPALVAPPPPAAPPMPLASFEPEVSETCEIPYSGPVTIIPVRNASALARSVADRPSRELVYATEDTAIFEDGRVLTLNMENLGTHLNAVGWSANPIKIMGAGVRPGGSRRNSAENTGKRSKKKRRRRR
jgi:hypothetical protein